MSRPRGAGTVEQAGNRWRFKCPDGAGGRFVSPAEYASEEEAEAALIAYRLARSRGELTPATGVTLRLYAEDTWLPRMQRDRPRSWKTYRSQWRSQVSKAPFVDWPLRSIRRRDVRGWISGLEVQHPEQQASVLRVILAAAIDDELLDVNPAARLRVARRRREDTSPTPDEVRALLSCAEVPWWVRGLVAVNVGTALRPGEWRHLRVEDVKLDADPPRLLVRRGSDTAEATKSSKPRVVPLFGLALEALRLWLEELPLYAPKNPKGLVWPWPDGRQRRASRPLGQEEGEDRWKVYLRAAGVRDAVRLHDLRHAAATSLLTGQHGRAWSTVEVQHLLGHASVKTTESTYLHPGEALVVNAARATVQNSPDGFPNPLKNAAERGEKQCWSSTSIEAVDGGLGGLKPDPWTELGPSGLVEDLRAALGRLRRDELSWDEARELVARVVEARRDADAVERAARRVGTSHWRAGFADLCDLLVPPAAARRGSGSSGVQSGSAK